ncbi:hypothetical protein [Thioclava sp. GXIMD4216]|uniref:Excalibur calcium-binding domain-containing protein n=1 Tax=Thioclava litoralis TaxID=3076557 RepID=A0ABZ1DW85_9RHOB|nr:hypothetical protein RPE78_10020 [Thioclava sp. FTW29]
MRAPVLGLSLTLSVLALAACQPSVPNSAAGVGAPAIAGNESYRDYMAQREAQLQGGTAATTTPVTGGQPMSAMGDAAAPASNDPNAQLGADTLAALNATAAQSSPQEVTDYAPASSPYSSTATAAERAEDTFQTPAPAQKTSGDTYSAGSGASGPNLAAYALSVSNQPGQATYPRGGIKFTSTTKACAKYVSPDQAQIAFLANGGPEKDPGNLDPDGDGFACGWDPRPFQNARN